LTRVDDDQQPAPLDVDTLPLHDALPILYESRDDVRNLVRVLEVRREALSKEEDSDSKRLELLRRIAELKNDRMRDDEGALVAFLDRKSTRLNSSHVTITYAVFCLKKNIT